MKTPEHIEAANASNMGVVSCIVIEALSALKGGGQTYLRNLFACYTPLDGERVVAIIPERFVDFLSVNPAIELIAPGLVSRGLLFRLFWNTFVAPRVLSKLGANVLFCPGGDLLIHPKGCRTAVAFQNMLPFSREEQSRFPMGYVRTRLWLLGFVQSISFVKADLVIFISQYAKSVINIALSARKGRSVVIPHGVGDDFRCTSAMPKPFGLPDEYVLYVSILDYYKAQVEVVEAWEALRRLRPTREKLVLVGSSDTRYGKRVLARIQELGLSGEIMLVGNIPYQELPAYYQNAKLNLFASSCENCPNILLEALAAGRPVLCSDYQPMPEFGAEAVLYFDPYNPDRLASLMRSMLDDEAALADWGRRAAARAKLFQWNTSAEQTWQALRHLASERQLNLGVTKTPECS